MRNPWNLQVSGPGEALPLVFLHGFMGNGEDWREVVEPLFSSFRCVTLDLPFHGKHTQPSPDLGSFEGFSAGLREVLTAHRLLPAVFIGYSMGGRLALTFAKYYPDDCRALVIESATPGLMDPHERRRRYQQDYRLASRLEFLPDKTAFAAFLQDWYRQPIFPTWAEDEEQRRRMVERRLHTNDPHGLAMALRTYSVGRQPSYWDDVGRWKMPMLWIAGGRDQKYSEIVSRVVGVSRHAQSWIAADVGHTVHAENPVGYTLRVRDFLHTVASQAPPKI